MPPRRFIILFIVLIYCAIVGCNGIGESVSVEFTIGNAAEILLENGVAYHQEITVNSDNSVVFNRSWFPPIPARAIIVGVHGIGGYSKCFERSGVYLAACGFGVYAIDLPGNGLSGNRGNCGTVDSQLALLHQFLSSIRERHSALPLYLIGYSLGGGHVLGFAARYQSAVDGIILLAPPVTSDIKNYQQLLPVILFSSLYPERRVNVFDYVNEVFYPTELVQQSIRDNLATKQYTVDYIRSLGAITGNSLLRKARTIQIPVLFMQGKEDTMNLYNGGVSLFKHIKSADKQFVVLDDAGHDFYGLFVFDDSFLNEKAYDILDNITCWIQTH